MAHGAHARVPKESVTESRVAIAIAHRNERFDGPAKQLIARESEKLLGLGVDQNNYPALIDDHHCVGRRLKQPFKFLLRSPSDGDVPNRSRDQKAVRSLQGA